MFTINKTFRLVIFCLLLCTVLYSCKKAAVCKEDKVENLGEFVKYSIDASNYNYTMPTDAVAGNVVAPGEYSSFFYPTVRVESTGQVDGNLSVISFNALNIAPNSDQPLKFLGVTALFGINNMLLPQTPINIHITECGQTGEYIAGDFSGIMTESMNTVNHFNVTCSFRVKRTF